MTSRERLFAVLNGQMPDRVPVSTYELVAFNSKAFENNEPSYAKLMEVIREKSDCIAMWEPKNNAVVFDSAYPADVEIKKSRQGNTTITEKTVHTPKGNISQITKVVDNIHTVWQVEHWCKSIDDVEKVISFPYEPVDYDISDLARIKKEVGDNGIIMSSPADVLWSVMDLMDFGSATVWAVSETEHFQKIINIFHERIMENLRRQLDAGVVDLYRICGPEYATPPYLPPSFFERFVVPYVKDMVDLIHSKGAKARIHCHGKIAKVLDMIVKTGCDAIDPCEAPPDGDIEFADVKKRVGDKLCIFGNIQLKLLEHGSENEVADAVKKCMDDAKTAGRFVIMPTAAPINVPLEKKTEENYITFIETALKYGKY